MDKKEKFDEFAKELIKAEKLNGELIDCAFNSTNTKNVDDFTPIFLKNTKEIIKNHSNTSISLLLVHLYFLVTDSKREEISKNGLAQTFSIISKYFGNTGKLKKEEDIHPTDIH